MKPKNASDSLSITTEIVLPNDTNNLNNLMGGRLLHWMDIAAAISAYRHCGRIVVTASVNHVSFTEAIPIENKELFSQFVSLELLSSIKFVVTF